MEPVVKSDVQLLIEHDRFESTFQFNFNDNVDVRVFCMGPIRFIGEMAYLGKYEQFKEEIDACVDALFSLFAYHEAVKEMPSDFSCRSSVRWAYCGAELPLFCGGLFEGCGVARWGYR